MEQFQTTDGGNTPKQQYEETANISNPYSIELPKNEDERDGAAEWIKTSKSIDFSLDGEQYAELSDERKSAILLAKGKIMESLSSLVEKTNSMERIGSLANLAKTATETFASEYGNVIDDSTADIIAHRAYEIASAASDHYHDDGEMRAASDEYTEDDNTFSDVVGKGAEDLSTAIKVASFSGDGKIIDTYMDIVVNHPLLGRYAKIHGIDNKRVEAYLKNVAPLVERKDPEVRSLWDIADGDADGFADADYLGDRFGISDFCIHALTSDVNPVNVQELLLAYGDVSSGKYATYEQCRNDGIEIEGILIDYRGFIHREASGEHEILSNMLQFYDTKDVPSEHEKAEAVLRMTQKKYYHYDLGDYMFDLKNYEKEGEQRKINGIRTGIKEPVIDALRRLVKNTIPRAQEKPTVEDAQLNTFIQNMHLGVRQSGEAFVDFEETGRIVKRMNEILIERQGTTGIKPSEVKAIAFVEWAATIAARGISDKQKLELPFSTDFKEMCRFAELTSQDGKYSEVGFEKSWDEFRHIKDLDNTHEMAVHLNMLSYRRLEQMRRLPDRTPFLKREFEALWSGNLNNELLCLTDDGSIVKNYN